MILFCDWVQVPASLQQTINPYDWLFYCFHGFVYRSSHST